MENEMDGTNEVIWTKRYQVIVDECYDTPEEADAMADKIGVLANVSTDFEEVKTTF